MGCVGFSLNIISAGFLHGEFEIEQLYSKSLAGGNVFVI